MWPFRVVSLFPLLFFKSVVAVRIEINQGILNGVLSKSRNGTEFYSFYSIPFAKPPVGEFRFESPKEADPWEGVRDAKTPPPACIQHNPLTGSNASIFPNVVLGQEDCLYLNVFTPNVSFSFLLPVMVYIHGGGYLFGDSSSVSPEYFMDHPLVVVTIQYRLAIFGFLSAADEVLPGNYGMKDQIAALKWVQKNIAAFGGDPKRVTIVGESAGGSSVHLHMHSPLSAGLFHQAVSQSGSGLAMCAIIKSETAKQRARALGVLSGCSEMETKALVECLRKVPAEQLAVAFVKFFAYDFNPPLPFTPVVEPRNVQGAFLIEDPWKQNPVNSVPWITGITTNEGSIFTKRIRSSVLDEWNLHYDRLLSMALYYFDRVDAKNSSTISTSIRNFYFGDKNISSKTEKIFSELFSHAHFVVPGLEAARRHTNKTFLYLYDHQNEHSFCEMFGNVTEDEGVCHTDDLISLFRIPVFPPVLEGLDLMVSLRMVNYWVNFIYNGDPNGKEKVWQPFESPEFGYLHIKTDVDVMRKKLLPDDKYNFWMNTLFSLKI